MALDGKLQGVIRRAEPEVLGGAALFDVAVRQARSAIALLFHQAGQRGERIVGGCLHLGCLQSGAAIGFQVARVFVIVAIQAQQFPVAAVGRVVVVIVVAVMHRQLLHVGVGEFTHAAPAYPRIHF